MENILIHYFSGTGNTLHMVEKLKESLSLKGATVHILNIEKENKFDFSNYTHHIFAFPIYGFGTPTKYLRYIKSLPKIKSINSSIICTCSGVVGQALSHSSSLLKKKGYKVNLTDVVFYPHTWTQMFPPMDEESQKKSFFLAEEKIESLADKIIANTHYFKSTSLLSRALSWVAFTGFSKLGRRILGKTFIADSTCTSCGLCEKVCPVNAIKIKKEGPTWNFKCESCQRCINSCPSASIQSSIGKFIVLISVELAALLLLIYLNYFLDISFILNIIIYITLTVFSALIANFVMSIAVKLPFYRKILSFSYTKKYGRYKI